MISEFRTQHIKVTTSAQIDALAQAHQILEANDSSEGEKRRATQTIEKINSLNQAMVGLQDEAKSQNQAGAGKEKQLKLTRFFSDVPDDFSEMFYDQDVEEFYKKDSFWQGKNIVSIGLSIKLKVDMDPVKQVVNLYMRKENEKKYSPTFLRLNIVEWVDFYEKMMKLKNEVDSLSPGENLAMFDHPSGKLEPDDEKFWDEEIVISSLTGNLKFRPYLSETKKLKGIFLEPRDANRWDWKGPCMRLGKWEQVEVIIKFLGYNINRMKEIGELPEKCA